MTRLHVVGCHRSGTTLLQTLIATCFRVDGAPPGELGLWQVPPGLARDALFVSKKPRDVRLLGRVLERDPELWAIYVVRDPRAVIASRVAGEQRWFVGLGTWLQCERQAARLAGRARFLELRYEDLVGDPDGAQRRLEAWAPFLERRHRFAEYERFAQPSPDALRAMHGLAAVDGTRNTGWRACLPRIAAERARWRDVDGGLDAALVRRCYEPDARWSALLDGVEPEHEPSRTPEREPPWKRVDRSLRDWRRVRRALAAIAARAPAAR